MVPTPLCVLLQNVATDAVLLLAVVTLSLETFSWNTRRQSPTSEGAR